MPALPHSPARVVKQALIDVGAADDPDLLTTAQLAAGASWPCYHESLPPKEPDRLVAVVTAEGTDDGRSQLDGVVESHEGVHVTVRGRTSGESYTKAAAVHAAMTEYGAGGVTGRVVTLDGTTYRLNAVTNVRRPVKVPEPSGRVRYVINATASLVASPTASLSVGLLAYYRFDGSLADASGNGQTLTALSGPAYIPGVLGQGASEMSLTRAAVAGVGSACSLSAWFKVGEDGASHVLGFGNLGFSVELDANLTDGSNVFGLIDDPSLPFDVSLVQGDKIHVVFVTDGAGSEFYVNGVSRGTSPTVPSVDLSAAAFTLGGNAGPATATDEVGVWDRALTAAEVLLLYDGGAGFDPTA
jgi:hypothetical protein